MSWLFDYNKRFWNSPISERFQKCGNITEPCFEDDFKIGIQDKYKLPEEENFNLSLDPVDISFNSEFRKKDNPNFFKSDLNIDKNLGSRIFKPEEKQKINYNDTIIFIITGIILLDIMGVFNNGKR